MALPSTLVVLSETHSHPCDDCGTAVECDDPRVRLIETAPWICLVYRETARPPFLCTGCTRFRLHDHKGHIPHA